MNINGLIKKIVRKVRSRTLVTRDFRIDKHIVVIESDDWGSIRMSSRESWEQLRSDGFPVDKRPYERFDTLESFEDVSLLFSVLELFTDSKGNHPCITANFLSVNPDFDKIRESGYHEYFYESISSSYSRLVDGDKVIPLIKEGIEKGLMKPQSHGREHFNIEEWMEALQCGDTIVRTAFEHRMCGIAPKDNTKLGNVYMVAFRNKTLERQSLVNKRIQEGLNLFEQLWGYKSKTFVAPCYTWNDSIETILKENGVCLIQTDRYQKWSTGVPSLIPHYMGQRGESGLIYSIRNCNFEPSTTKRENEVQACLSEIRSAFASNRPAIVSTHRINFVGGLSPENRKKNLKMFSDLLSQLLQEFPDVEFMTSDQLASLLSKN